MKKTIALILKILACLALVALIVILIIVISKATKRSQDDPNFMEQKLYGVSSNDETGETEPPKVILPSGKIIYGSGTYDTYTSMFDAQNHPQYLPNVLENFKISYTVEDETADENKTARVCFWVDWSDSGKFDRQEVILHGDQTATFDLTRYAGQQIIIGIKFETNDLVPKTSYEYVSFILPDSIGQMEQIEPETSEVLQTEASEPETDTVPNPEP